MTSLPFVLSDTLKERLRASGTAATTNTQLSAMLPQPDLQTQASPSPQYTALPYSYEVITSGAVGHWHMSAFSLGGFDYVAYFNGLIMHFDLGTVARYYGYILPFTGTHTPSTVSYVAGALAAAGDTAVAFTATDGFGITYFPVVGFEPNFIGSLGFDVDEDFTWEIWIKTTQTPGGAVRILEQASGGVFPYRIQMLPSGAIRASRSDGTLTAQVDSAQTVNDDVWHYVAVYKDGASFGVAIDDNAATTTTDTLVGVATPTSTSLTVDGAIAGDGFVGALDEPALYDFALTASQRLRRLAAAAGDPVPV